ncbi:AAA-ATPase ASD, mitochondrial-like [Panicum virgatum]|uniref:AAA+ ATPase domain-containing protein n=1 Tax=Panicum virgatum TaxID=38727 RepID=A0A8T0N8G6_PANVG|nr:AAA-ATPase ASD, mitochondrial-like [Panicum virgatum]KAG2545138.1 hypothetical protein PVAP13_9KG411095 [Panicum virgatum]
MEASSLLSGGLNSGVVLSLIAVLWTVVWQNLQHLQLQQFFGRHLSRHARRLAAMVDPYLSVTIAEYEGGRMKRSDAYEEVKAYLSAACSRGVRHLRAEGAKDADKLVLSMVDGEEVADEFEGATVWWWAYSKSPPRADAAAAWWGGGGAQEERRFYRLFFLERHRELVLDTYLPRVRQQGRAVMVKNRQRKLFTNISTHQWSDGGYMRSAWSHVVFEHPKTFDTLAMDPAKKKEITDDLDMFKNGKDYYARVGKAWKRGYLLYGPPGTGKSAMIAAMANYLDYDIYDIELTSVHSNTDLRKLFIETTSKSIIVIEDIDCSLDLTGARNKKKAPAAEDDKKGGAAAAAAKAAGDKNKDTSSKVTLSGLLNFIDGLWSACGGERIIVFTTNHVRKLDPALIRRGRMDKHIEMSYCGFEAFKFLAKTYLDVDAHALFGAVGELLREVEMTPADVAENLTPKSLEDNPDTCLAALVKALEEAKEKKAASGGNDPDQQEDDEEEQ